MTPELRDFVLGLPLDVRKELGELGDEMGWSLVGLPGSALCEAAFKRPTEIYDTPGNNRAWVPASPISVALRAAKLAGRFDSHWVSVSVMPCFNFEHSMAYMASNPSPRHQSDIGVEHTSVMNDDSDCDPTGHRAAIALLMKVMEIEKQ